MWRSFVGEQTFVSEYFRSRSDEEQTSGSKTPPPTASNSEDGRSHSTSDLEKRLAESSINDENVLKPVAFEYKPRERKIDLSKQHIMTSASMFDKNAHSDRPAPEMPSTVGIEYPRAASWSSSTVEEILRDSIGRQVFRCFLFQSLAEENLLFVEAIEELEKDKDGKHIRDGIKDLLNNYGSYINLSSKAMAMLKEAAEAEHPNPKALEVAHKEISKLLENDQFPRFRRSAIYIEYLEQLLPKSYAERWSHSFEALLGNQVGRHHFRQYLFSVHAEENLRFWEAVVEYRALKDKSAAMQNMGKTIYNQYLREGAHNEIFLPFGVRQGVEKLLKEKEVDQHLFDNAIKHVEQLLKNDPYVRFLQSKEYNDLLAKLK
ncbi:unnamed protein product [Bursaphelenchus xylophilus]|uniref:(pine wood nematode) hypothetical protein n=1 Tax=Bursaphelenchus xylophilus TaxID=6326 RepID=A0A1I7SCN8_BURXY|nr:unnamed protein product [Bursaphelenchus xylophilus]CAG9093779.1 unnamed protein product [Bursaphelenchus xylophilus]